MFSFLSSSEFWIGFLTGSSLIGWPSWRLGHLAGWSEALDKMSFYDDGKWIKAVGKESK